MLYTMDRVTKPSLCVQQRQSHECRSFILLVEELALHIMLALNTTSVTKPRAPIFRMYIKFTVCYDHR